MDLWGAKIHQHAGWGRASFPSRSNFDAVRPRPSRYGTGRQILAAVVAVILLLVPAAGVAAEDADAVAAELKAVKSEALDARTSAKHSREKAEEWREQAEQTRERAEEIEHPRKRAEARREARDLDNKAKDADAQADRLDMQAKSKESRAATLKERLRKAEQEARGDAQTGTKSPAETPAPTDSAGDTGGTARAAEAEARNPNKLELEDVLGFWSYGSDEDLFEIVQEFPDGEGRENRLELKTEERVWTGSYEPSDQGQGGRSQDARVVFRYRPKAEEMKPEIPIWARRKFEGEIEWEIRIDDPEDGEKTSLESKFYPGEIFWQESLEEGEGRAWPGGDGEPRTIPLTANTYRLPPFLGFEAASFPRTPSPGQPALIAFRVENTSDLTAAEVTVDLSLGPWVSTAELEDLKEVEGSFCALQTEGGFRCTLGDMEPGDYADLVFDAKVPKTGAISWGAGLDSTGDLIGRNFHGGFFGDPSPRIADVVVLHDLQAVEDGVPEFPYPFGSRRGGLKSLYLLVVGYNLPQKRADRVALGGSESIDYRFLAFPDTDNPAHQDLISDGWKRFYELDDEAAARKRAEKDGLTAVLVRADLKPSALPGQRAITLSGASGHWLLEFTNLSARFGFVRRSTQGLHYLSNTYFPGRIHVAVETREPLPVDEIPIVVTGQLGSAQALEQELKLVARLTTINEGSGGTPRRVYLTGPIDVQRLGMGFPLEGGQTITIDPGWADIAFLEARIDEGFAFDKFHLALDPVTATVRVKPTPTTSYGASWLWKDALHRAAACHDDIDVQDWDRLTAKESDVIRNGIFFPPQTYLRKSIKFGHHAAAILLRDMYIETVDRQVPKVRDIRADLQKVRGMIAYLKPRAVGDADPILRMKVKDFRGREQEYRYAIMNSPEWLSLVYGLPAMSRVQRKASIERIKAWQVRATVDALDRMVTAMEASRSQAYSTEDCDVEDLIRLTGFSFQPIARRLKAELVTLKDWRVRRGDTPVHLWIPDNRALQWVDRVAPLAEAVKRQRLRGDVDTDIILFGVTLATLPFMLSESAVVALVTFAVDLADLGVTSVNEISGYMASQDELEFALGATVVLGDERYKRAEEEAKDWASTVFQVGTAGFGAFMGGIDAVSKADQLARITRGRQVARSVKVPRRISRLAYEDLRDFGAFVLNARARAHAFRRHAMLKNEKNAVEMTEQFGASRRADPVLPEPNPPAARQSDPLEPSTPIKFDPAEDADATLTGARGPSSPRPAEETTNTPAGSASGSTPPARDPIDDYHGTDLEPGKVRGGGPPADFKQSQIAKVRTSPSARKIDRARAGTATTPPNAVEARTAPNSKYAFRAKGSSDAEPVKLPLGAPIHRGSTSEAFEHADFTNTKVIRITGLGEKADKAAIAVELDRYGEKVLKRVNSPHIRVAEIEADYLKADYEFPDERIERVTVMEHVEPAEILMARGGFTDAHRGVLEDAIRDLNRQGYFWLDNKSNNFGFTKKPPLQVVVFDAGGIGKARDNPADGSIRARTAAQNAREIQLFASGPADVQIPLHAHKDTWNRLAQRSTRIHWREYAFDLDDMPIGDSGQLGFNPSAGRQFPEVARRLLEDRP